MVHDEKLVQADPETDNTFPYKLLIFDLDRTLMQPTEGKQWPADEHDREPIPGRIECLLMLRETGVKMAVATNQGGIAYGHYDHDKLYSAIVGQVQAAFGITHVALCPHHPKGTLTAYRKVCECRKPRPGMLFKLMDTFGVQPDETLFVGDDVTDEEAARNAGCDFAYADEFFFFGADEGIIHAARA